MRDPELLIRALQEAKKVRIPRPFPLTEDAWATAQPEDRTNATLVCLVARIHELERQLRDQAEQLAHLKAAMRARVETPCPMDGPALRMRTTAREGLPLQGTECLVWEPRHGFDLATLGGETWVGRMNDHGSGWDVAYLPLDLLEVPPLVPQHLLD